jgi:hypothetical protein
MNAYRPIVMTQTIVEFAPRVAPAFNNVRRYSFLRAI